MVPFVSDNIRLLMVLAINETFRWPALHIVFA